MIDWLVIHISNLIFDKNENFWQYQSNVEFDGDGFIKNISEMPGPDCHPPSISHDNYDNYNNSIDDLTNLPTFKEMSISRKKHIIKMKVLQTSNKLLASQTISSFSRYQQLMHRVFNAWYLYSHRKFIARMIAKRLAEIKQSKLTIFRQWKRLTVLNKIVSLQKQIDQLQTQLRLNKIDTILIQHSMNQTIDKDEIKNVTLRACDFLNNDVCDDCNIKWTQQYSDAFRKKYKHIKLFKTLL